MKKLFARFMKDTRGVVMLEYIILGLFAVAVTLVAVATLGKAYNNGLLAMAYATTGSATEVTNVIQASYEAINIEDVVKVNEYGKAMADGGASVSGGASTATYDVFQ